MRGLIRFHVLLAVVAAAGCAHGGAGPSAAVALQQQGITAERIEAIETTLAKVTLILSQNQAGRDVNPAWTEYLMVLSVPVCFVVYVLSKRTRLYRQITGQAVPAKSSPP